MEMIFVVVMLIVAFFTGTFVEKRHYKNIRKREKELLAVPVVTSEDIEYLNNIADSEMVTGNVVISLDYFKRFLAGLRNFFGGRIMSYESLLDRGRREAILRMKKEAVEKGYSIIINMRFETSSIGMVTAQANLGCFEVLAYGTAIRTQQN